MHKAHFPSSLRVLGLGAAIALSATPALAQAAPEEIVITGRFGRVPDSVRSLSAPVGYADLDISTEKGRDLLRQRVRLTARYLCNKLGEPETASPPVPSCRDEATKDAMSRVDTVMARAAPRGTTWVAGPAWQPPYPADWATKYR